MPIYTLDPLSDSRWKVLAASHPRSSVFHQYEWLLALNMTYGYRPIVLTSTPPGKTLSEGIVFCEVTSRITGSRLVSLPFADHAEPLLNETSDLSCFAEYLQNECIGNHWKYVELRPLSDYISAGNSFAESESYWFHTLDLSPSIDIVFSNLHKNCIQRRIRRAEREQLSYETGNSETMLEDFYQLLLRTRRRHRVPPQPRAWFRNLVGCMGPNLSVRLLRKNGVPIAAILTLRHGGMVVYKYGCSDERFHHLAGMPLLFWKLIEESKLSGAMQIDFGRTDMDNDGLIEFKDRFGTSRRRITYYRYPEPATKASQLAAFKPIVRRLCGVMPDIVSSAVGRLVYRHFG